MKHYENDVTSGNSKTILVVIKISYKYMPIYAKCLQVSDICESTDGKCLFLTIKLVETINIVFHIITDWEEENKSEYTPWYVLLADCTNTTNN